MKFQLTSIRRRMLGTSVLIQHGAKREYAAGRDRTGDFEIFSLALSQTELPRREGAERPAGQKVSVRRTPSSGHGGSGVIQPGYPYSWVTCYRTVAKAAALRA